MRLSLPLLLLALSCRTGDKTQSDTAGLGDGAAIDADGDGFAGDEDCDDTDATVNGGATEVCDGIDNNCDGSIDEGVGLTGFFDRDGDSFGDPDAPTEACDLPSGVVSNANDCDDDNPEVFPGAIEICNDIDDDCDGGIDEDLLYTFYLDLDGDGYGDPDAPIEACEAPEGSSGNALDCDDSDDTVSPGAVEVCNEVDDDCDGDIDEDVTLTYYLDADGDGWGGDGATVEACDLPMGYASRTGDCDDADISFFPGAPEPDCTDPNDYNCDGSVAWADDDGDGWVACEECDDTDASIHPAAVEICDGIDNDCNGDTDDADVALDLSTASTWYRDSDGDRYGDPASSTRACVLPSGYLADNTDCDDASAQVHPGAVEICNSIDDDCDLLVDDADSSLDTSSASAWYNDGDGDGYGDAGARTLSCSQPSGTVANDSDCDDGLATINPSATEICDLIDNDCDSNIDDADIDVVGRSTWYQDADSDGYGGSTSTLSCSWRIAIGAVRELLSTTATPPSGPAPPRSATCSTTTATA